MSTQALREFVSNLTLYDIRIFLRITLLILGSIAFIRWFMTFLHNRSLYKKFPQIPSTAIVGNLLGHLEYFWNCRTHLPLTVFFGNLALGLTKVFHQENVGLFYFRIGPFRNIVMIVKARTSEAILSSTKNIVKATEYDFLKPWIGQGLLLGQGPHWKMHRKLLTPTFHFEILEKFIPTMNAKVTIMMNLLNQKKNNETNQIHIKDMRPFITNCTVDIICETAMGIKMSGQEEWFALEEGNAPVRSERGNKYSSAVKEFLKIVLKRLISPWMYSDFIFSFTPLGRKMNKHLKDMHDFTNSVIISRKKELESKYDSTATIEQNFKNMSSNKRMAFLDLMLGYHFKDPKEMDLVSIREEVDTFMFGGHDTTSTTLHFAFLLIGTYIDKQRLIQEELDEIFADDIDKVITLEDTKKMIYLEMAIKETMRLYPPAAFFGRKIVEEQEIDGYKIPIGTTILVLSYAIHRDPEVYDQAERFIPERFEPNSKVSKNPFGFIPFSAGSRNCIGQRFAMLELKILLATVFRKYDVKTLTKQELVEVDISIITKSNTPIECVFTPRQKFV